ncbi:MAG: UDP-N-acetylglucosamine 1-carboxyvinyltransferase [Ruminococcaceae bacterium]|nr:UDP-N-acetylglucosamine 1-carboxyvinyltransferase [Oscillospiraceae bacterium]
MYVEKLTICGKKRLNGTLSVQGSKNSTLPIIAAAVLCEGEIILHNCPHLTDVGAAVNILSHLGCKIRREGDTLIIDSTNIETSEISEKLMHEMRSSIVFLGALLARTGKAVLSTPGGCEIGLRPIDLHLRAMRDLGTAISEEGGKLFCTAPDGIRGREITLAFPSVGATENVLLAASLGKGRTILNNAAREPEIKNLADFLTLCGAKIYFAGEGKIIIDGVKKLHGCEFRVISDRIVAATYMAAAAVTGGEIDILNFPVNDVTPVLPQFEACGCKIVSDENRMHIKAPSRLKSMGTVRTMPYPGFPTDFQAPAMTMASVAEGTAIFIETIFESRYKHVSELKKMGANITTQGTVAVVQGVKRLTGAKVYAEDLRGGAALVLAGLAAEGKTEVYNLKHIDRGYEKIEEKLSSLGAEIEREV